MSRLPGPASRTCTRRGHACTWISGCGSDLRRAANGEPREASDLRVLAAVQDAAEKGVAFPLSTTHHIETSKITNPRQRLDVARTMASISHCRTLRARKVLLRHQMLHAMHLAFGRPAFRPQAPEVLGTGVRWAFDGEPGHGVLRGLTAWWIRPRSTGCPSSSARPTSSPR